MVLECENLTSRSFDKTLDQDGYTIHTSATANKIIEFTGKMEYAPDTF